MSSNESPTNENPGFDQQVGRNITLFRGSITQQDLAERMRQSGFKWSQATVWATEKGDRPVRLAEVVALSRILEKPYDAFFLEELDGHYTQYISDRLGELLGARGSLKSSIKRWLHSREDIFKTGLGDSENRPTNLPKHTQEQLDSDLERIKYLETQEHINDIYQEAQAEVGQEISQDVNELRDPPPPPDFEEMSDFEFDEILGPPDTQERNETPDS